MRQFIIDEITEQSKYRDTSGKPLYTTISGLLFFDEIDHIKNSLKFDVINLTVGYNLIVFRSNFT